MKRNEDKNDNDKSRSVFVGNIAPSATESELKTFFSSIGPVVSFRIMVDKETSNSKGYGFCEFMDSSSATAAIRILNNKDFRGKNLRVDRATGANNSNTSNLQPMNNSTSNSTGNNVDGSGMLYNSSPYHHSYHHGNNEDMDSMSMDNKTNGNNQQMNDNQELINEYRQHGRIVGEEDAEKLVFTVLNQTSPEQLTNVIRHLKRMQDDYEPETKSLLLNNPQLAYAVVQIMHRLNMIDKKIYSALFHPENRFNPPIKQENINKPLLDNRDLPTKNNNIMPNNMGKSGGLLDPPKSEYRKPNDNQYNQYTTHPSPNYNRDHPKAYGHH
ncbi:hypothetical protein SNEBB_008719 [Seison nebaliae]|nr:hypothetical protein SNEBB_008719 [Seison nebaliae]